eukprot:maker-scaffold_78-snap-gene-0.1-mRNA-1 protein AED:0.01 eAED:0.01 QI:143/1/1/1/1/1/2/42/603
MYRAVKLLRSFSISKNTTSHLSPLTWRASSTSWLQSKKAFSTLNLSNNLVDESLEPRDSMEYDVVIVGAGPAGLSAAIRLKQIDEDLNVCVVEKAAELGAHILSGNVFEPRALNELFPNWKEDGMEPFGEDPTPAANDTFKICYSEKGHISLPGFAIPPMLHNEGNYIISLSQFVRWLGEQAEDMGVEIYPGFPASEVIFDEDENKVLGVVTKDMGIGKDGQAKDTYTRGMELRGRQTIFSEGARGSCSEDLMKRFNLRDEKVPQSYGIGLKEVWEIPEENLKPGLIQHTLGWPLGNSVYGGTFLYHMKPNYILFGLVVGLDYKNPYLNPYKEFQRLKHHPAISEHLKDGQCISYGARAINEGGFQAIPKLSFPGGVLAGCSAGFLNVPKIKGTHTAMKSGIVAAEAIAEHLANENEAPEVASYQTKMEESWVWEELKKVRNFAPSFKWGNLAGVAYSGVAAHVLRGHEPWTFTKTTQRDADKTAEKNSSYAKEIEYPKPDGVLSFDILENLQRSGTNHDHDQPAHLVIKPELQNIPENVSLQKYAGPEQRFCPAKVYEYVEDKLVINAQNCVHCKTCDIKMTDEYIRWTVPEGGGGPAYDLM